MSIYTDYPMPAPPPLVKLQFLNPEGGWTTITEFAPCDAKVTSERVALLLAASDKQCSMRLIQAGEVLFQFRGGVA